MPALTNAIFIIVMAWLMAGCASSEPRPVSNGAEPPTEQAAAVAYYIARLPDRDYVETYGDVDNRRSQVLSATLLNGIRTSD